MIPRSLIYCFLAISMFTALSSVAHGDPIKIAEVRSIINDSIRPIVTQFDPQATFVLDLKVNLRKEKLPGTPFTFSDLEINDDTGNFTFADSKLTIYSEKSTLPAHTSDALTQVLQSYGVKAALNLISIPQPPASTYMESIRNTLTSPSNALLMFFALGLWLTLILGFLLHSRSQMAASNALREGVTQVVSALQSQGPAPSEARTTDEPIPTSKPHDQETTINDRELLGHLPYAGALELLADCYWSHQDSYASYIWPRLSIEVRENLNSGHSWVAPYARYFCRLPHDNLNLHNDPYYLKPLPLHHLSNPDLSVFTTKNIAIYNVLSPIRLEHLSISPSQRLNARASTISKLDELTSKLKSTKPSSPRDMSAYDLIVPQSVADEDELLSLDRLNPADKLNILSLIWAKDIPQTRLKELLEGFSAQNLAQSWIGPQVTLDLFANCLPEKKRALTVSYLEQIKPSRKSSTYKSLCALIHDELRNSEVASENEVLQKAS